MSTVYKICAAAEWARSEVTGIVPASADDQRDGFIHLSTSEQLDGTISRHFLDQDDLMLLAIDPEKLGASLRWEPSRGGALFPHCYGPIQIAAVTWARPLDRAHPGQTIGAS